MWYGPNNRACLTLACLSAPPVGPHSRNAGYSSREPRSTVGRGREERGLAKLGDPVAQPSSTDIGVPTMLSLQAKKLRNLPRENVRRELCRRLGNRSPPFAETALFSQHIATALQGRSI